MTKTTKDMKFGERLMQTRNAAQLTRPQLSKLTQIPTRAIEKFEYGTQDPTLARVQTLAKALNVTDEYLSKGDDVEIPEIEIVDAVEVQDEVLGTELDQATQKLAYLDELREIGFQKHWRTAPRLFAELTVSISKFELDDLLDLAELRGLYAVSDDDLEGYADLETDDQETLFMGIVNRILDTAYFGIDLYHIRMKDLEIIAYKQDIDGDSDKFFGPDWTGYAAITQALRLKFWDEALRGNNPDFINEDNYKKREDA